MGHDRTNWELDFKQCSFHHIMQVLRVCAFCAFSAPPAFPPCYCPLAFRHQVRRLTSRISSESHPGSQECVTNYHGAGEFTCVHHTIHPAPTPPDAGRDTVPSRWWCQSRDCGYCVRGHVTARYLAAVPRRILLMQQQVWSIQRARHLTLRPRGAASSTKGPLSLLWHWRPVSLPVWGVAAGSGVAHIAISPSAVGALLLPLCLTRQAGKRILMDKWSMRLPCQSDIMPVWVSNHPQP